jgi:drug/metabolite transporter (DMT)-like permease
MPQRRDLVLIVVTAFVGMTAYQLLLNTGELTVPAGTSSIIVAGAPLVSVAIAVVAFKERLSVVRVVGSVVAVGGVILVCVARSGVSVGATVWVVVGAMVVQGIYHPLSRTLLRKYTSVEVAVYAMIAGAVMTIPFVPFGWHDITSANGGAWLAAIYLGLLPSALGFVLWGYAVARLPVVTATSLLYLVPPVAVLIAFVWLHELPLLSELVGGVIVIIGVAAISQGDGLLARVREISKSTPERERK